MNRNQGDQFIFIQAPSYRKPRATSIKSKKTDPLAMPYGGLYLAESLMRKNISMCILLGEIEELTAQISQHVGQNTIAFGMSSYSGDMLKSALIIARYLRTNYPNIPIVWGGVHVTAVRTGSLIHELVDFIAWGEGEQSTPQLLEAISNGSKPEDLKNIKGIGYKVNGKTFITPSQPATPLNRSFNLPYHLVDMERVKRKMLIGCERFFGVTSSRRCPFRCTFCSNSSTSNPLAANLRYHAIDDVVQNISVLVNKYGADCIGFQDEVTVVEKKRIVELCDGLRSLGKDIKFRMQTTISTILRWDDELLKYLRDNNFVALDYGVESGSDRILKFIGKKITVKQIHEAQRRLKNMGFYQSYNMLFCLPTETVAEMKESVRMFVHMARETKYCPYPFSRMEPYIPLPDTLLYNIAMKHGFVPPTTMEGWTEFDSQQFAERRKRLRPWLSEEKAYFAALILKASDTISDLFTGPDANHDLIDYHLDEMEKLIDYPLEDIINKETQMIDHSEDLKWKRSSFI